MREDLNNVPRPKAVRDGYSPPPFFFRQDYQAGNKRWVAWADSVEDLKPLFYRLLDSFTEEVEVLFKNERDDSPQSTADPWQRYHGACLLKEVASAIRRHEELVFQDGGNQLCIRCADEGDYLALDEHGILFLYAEGDGFAALCRELGFEEGVRPLLYEGGHWREYYPQLDDL